MKRTSMTQQTVTRRRVLAAVGASVAGAGLGSSPLSWAQSAYPNRPIKLVVPWPPGQATDLAARVLAQELTKSMGVAVVIENKAGAGGTIGTDAVAKATPDGYTVLAASSGPVTVSPLLQKTPYDVERDLVPIGMMGMSPYILVTSVDFPAKDASEFVALVKANPRKYSFASSGTGATAHLIAESFNAALGLQAVHIPYKGSIPALTDVISGQVAYCIETAASTMPFIRNGRLKAFGVSIEKGSSVAPGIAPLAVTASVPGGFDLGAWLGLMVPTGTPKPIVEKLSMELSKAMQVSEVKQAFSTIAVEVDYRKADDLVRYLKVASSQFGEVIKRNNIKLD